MATQYFARTVQIATASTFGTEPASWVIGILDTKAPFIKVDTKAVTYDTSVGKKVMGYDASFEVVCYDAIGMATVDALVGTNVWLQTVPDGTLGATNPAIHVKDFILCKETSLTGTFATPSEVRYFGQKFCQTEADAFVKVTA